MCIFKGAATALITPFKSESDSVDFEALERLVNFQLENGISALIVGGTTGEPTTMTHSERSAVSKFVLSQVKGRIPVILGAGSNNTYTSIEYAIEAEDLGADAVLVITPYYNKCTQSGLVAHFRAIADRISIPLILYNVPGRTGVNIDPKTALELSAHKNIVAIKEASGNLSQFMSLAPLIEGKLDLYSGDDALVYPLLSLGAKGVISVASNIIPRYMSDLTNAYFCGDLTKSRTMQFKVNPLVSALFSEVSPIPVKCAAKMLGLCDDYMRLPLTRHTKKEELKQTMREFGLNPN
ncbi:MAG: 4-hydroxy-tetrahydrodipicolinate synthase [Christensenellaceae bacterium]|jgi:4-hydroxy-tetrahydrodipicolinate synthase|nr:4-hydroxy-tetrahydrodipicolinate synthase [Christensenellaceae bacterium]